MFLGVARYGLAETPFHVESSPHAGQLDSLKGIIIDYSYIMQIEGDVKGY